MVTCHSWYSLNSAYNDNVQNSVAYDYTYLWLLFIVNNCQFFLLLLNTRL